MVNAVANEGIKIQTIKEGMSFDLGDGARIDVYSPIYESYEEFNDYSPSASKIEASLCPTPEKEDWTYKDIAEDGYSSTFAVGGKASLVLYATKKISTSSDHIEVMYVFRDADGNVLSDLISTESLVWKSMWSNRYAALNIPAIPAAAGSYTLEVYFNGALAVTKPITITE